MTAWARYLVCALAGVVLGIAATIYSVRHAALGNAVTIGPWATGQDFGSAREGAFMRAVVALKGLFALPAHEARYYTATTDSAGVQLNGLCRYRITGAALPAAWWTLTAYDADGYLIPNAAHRYSLMGSAFPDGGKAGWSIAFAPTRRPGAWLPSGAVPHPQLTLRTYLPSDGGSGNPGVGTLPRIVREAC